MSRAVPQTTGREEEAKLALEHTEVSRGVAWMLSAAFLATIFAVPLAQSTFEIQRNAQERRAQIAVGEEPSGAPVPQVLEAASVLPSREELRSVKSASQAWALVPEPEEMSDFESALEGESLLVQWLLPRAQGALAGWPGVGNEQAYIGRPSAQNGAKWLHYRPDADYLTSPGFLDPSLLSVRERAGNASNRPDPLPAIEDFARQLRERNITLILMPTPIKAMLQPETLSARYASKNRVLQNPSYEEFVRRVQVLGAKLFDPSALLAEEFQRTQKPVFLRADTHWAPEAMELSARGLAQFIAREVKLPPAEAANYTRSERQISGAGDIAEMLKLPPGHAESAAQNVRIRPVKIDGEAWSPSRSADVLLLGDSFSNIYSLEGLGWGEGAGFAEQLSFAMKRPVDAIISNAGGAHATRERLASEMRRGRGRNRLKPKRVVVWQFAMRDLLGGDWKLVELPRAPK